MAKSSFTFVRISVAGLVLFGSIAAQSTETQTYRYDVFGRLIETIYSGSVNNGQAHTTCFDAASNRIEYKSDSGGAQLACAQAILSAVPTATPTPSPTTTPSPPPTPQNTFSGGLVAGSVGYPCNSLPCTTPQGYLQPGMVGSLTPNTFGGGTITQLYSVNSSVTLVVDGMPSVPSNWGWTSITVPGSGTLLRAAATYSASSNSASWTWSPGATKVANGMVTIQ